MRKILYKTKLYILVIVKLIFIIPKKIIITIRDKNVHTNFIKLKNIFSHEGPRGLLRILRVLYIYGSNEGFFYRNDYKTWILYYDTLNTETRNQLINKSSQFQNKPLISIIMPTYNSNIKWLKQAIDSVRQQIYTNWELCISDDASTNSNIREMLEYYQSIDQRIKVLFRKKNGHISVASNEAISLASGEWIALFDHDDLLSEHALFYVVDSINKNSTIKLIYSDEDKVDEFGNRMSPYFKPDWNIDLFYSQNFFSHFGIYKKDLIQKIDGFRVGFEGSQDYDLVLRCLEHVSFDQIHHISKVLYHWRMHENSTAQLIEAKSYSLVAGKKALREHLLHRGINAVVETIGAYYAVTYTLPSAQPLVSLVLLTKNKLDLLFPCVTSILEKTTYTNYELLIIDNGSDDPKTLEYLKDIQNHPKIQVISNPRSFNYSALNNFGVRHAKGEIIGLLNNDIEVISSHWIEELGSLTIQPGVGAVGAKLYFPDETIQHAGVILGIGGVANHAHKELDRAEPGYFSRAMIRQSVSAVTGACLFIRKSIYDEVKGLDESIKVAFNDVDFCLRIKEKGYRNVWTPYAELYHHESKSRGQEDTPEKQSRFISEVRIMEERWGDKLLTDPAYNPNLTFSYNDFSLAWPPRNTHVMSYK